MMFHCTAPQVPCSTGPLAFNSPPHPLPQDTLCLEGTISDYTVMFGEQVQDLAANGGLLMVPPGVSLRVFQGSGQPPYKSILAPRGSDPLAAVPTLTSIERVRLTVGVKA
jgi:hypothetical protein